MPSIAPVTCCSTKQAPLLGIKAPVLRVNEVAVLVTVPKQVVVARPTVTKPAGSVSVNGAVKAAAGKLGLISSSLIVVISPAMTTLSLNDLLISGGMAKAVLYGVGITLAANKNKEKQA